MIRYHKIKAALYKIRFSTIFLNIVMILSTLIVLSFNFLLSKHSRPTADEYFLGAAFRGFYWDAPNNTLFSDENLFLNYLNSIISFSQLGWDNFFNTASFQMFPAIMLNFFGPASSVVMSLFYSLIMWSVIIGFVAKTFRQSNIKNVGISSVVLSGFYIFLLFSNYPVYQGANVFVLSGIRLGTYLIYGFILWFILRYLIEGIFTLKKHKARLIVVFFLTPCLFSFWYTIYFLIFSALIIIYSFFLKNVLISRKLIFFCYLITLSLSFLINFGVFKPKVEGNRSILSHVPFHQVLLDFIKAQILNSNSRIYTFDYLGQFFNFQTIIPLVLGFCLIKFTNNQFLTINNITTIRILSFCMITFYLIFPFIFAFQEYVTYEAYWHATIIFTISFFTFLTVGIMLSNLKIASHLKSRAPNFFIIGFVFFLFLFQSSFDKTKQSLKYLQDFSNSWDQGNVFGIGFPIENTSTYSINNFMVLAPYINKNSMPEWLASKNKFFINNSEFNKDEPITILSKGSSNIFTPITVDPVILYKLNSNFSLQISLNSSAKIASAQLGSLSIFPQIFEQKTKDGDFEYILTFMNPKIEETNTLLTINFIKNLSDNDVKLVFVDFKIDYLVKYYG